MRAFPAGRGSSTPCTRLASTPATTSRPSRPCARPSRKSNTPTSTGKPRGPRKSSSAPLLTSARRPLRFARPDRGTCHSEVADAPAPPPKSPTRQSRYGDGARLRRSSEGGKPLWRRRASEDESLRMTGLKMTRTDSWVGSVREPGVPVHDDGGRDHGLTPEGREQKETLTVGRGQVMATDVANRLNRRPEEGSRNTGLERLAGLDVDRHQLLVARAVIELLAVGPPSRLDASGGGHLPFASRAGEVLNVDLGAARLVRLVGDPAPVGREGGA